MSIVKHMYELIGNTPIVQLDTPDDSAELFVKLEWFNPGGSVKDRIALQMILDAVESGRVKPGDTIVEPTSGNTGIGLAFVAQQFGIKSVLVMPESLSLERRGILKGLGATLVLTPKEQGMKGAIEVANQLEIEKGYIQMYQFDSPSNPKAHYEHTSLEILKDVPDLDAFVAGVGTGGTITGTARRLKETKEVKIVAVEPKKSAVLSGNAPGPHGIQGIGAGFIPSVVQQDLIDEIIQVEDEDAFETARKLAKTVGLFAGISTGANVFAALKVAKELGPGKKVVTVSPSNGERYLSTDLYK